MTTLLPPLFCSAKQLAEITAPLCVCPHLPVPNPAPLSMNLAFVPPAPGTRSPPGSHPVRHPTRVDGGVWLPPRAPASAPDFKEPNHQRGGQLPQVRAATGLDSQARVLPLGWIHRLACCLACCAARSRLWPTFLNTRTCERACCPVVVAPCCSVFASCCPPAAVVFAACVLLGPLPDI